MVNFFTAFLGVFFSGQQASILFGFSSSKSPRKLVLYSRYLLLPGMTKAINAANYVFWLEELQPLIKETPENSRRGPDNFSNLNLENLQFSYPLRPHARILRGIDLHVSLPLSTVQLRLSRWINQRPIFPKKGEIKRPGGKHS